MDDGPGGGRGAAAASANGPVAAAGPAAARRRPAHRAICRRHSRLLAQPHAQEESPRWWWLDGQRREPRGQVRQVHVLRPHLPRLDRQKGWPKTTHFFELTISFLKHLNLSMQTNIDDSHPD